MSLIIFDFDGTIANSLVMFIEATNRLAKDFGYSPIASTQIAYFRTLSLQGVALELGIPIWKLPCYLQRFRQELTRLIADLELIEGMDTTLMTMKQQGYRLGIVTANSRQNVEYFLDKYDLDHLFEFVYGGKILSGKARTLKKLARLNAVDPKQLVYIGDEINDVKAANRTGLTSVAVSWGFNDRQVLTAQTPDFFVNHPEQLLGIASQVSRLN